jgi:hypothetical protein
VARRLFWYFFPFDLKNGVIRAVFIPMTANTPSSNETLSKLLSHRESPFGDAEYSSFQDGVFAMFTDWSLGASTMPLFEKGWGFCSGPQKEQFARSLLSTPMNNLNRNLILLTGISIRPDLAENPSEFDQKFTQKIAEGSIYNLSDYAEGVWDSIPEDQRKGLWRAVAHAGELGLKKCPDIFVQKLMPWLWSRASKSQKTTLRQTTQRALDAVASISIGGLEDSANLVRQYWEGAPESSAADKLGVFTYGLSVLIDKRSEGYLVMPDAIRQAVPNVSQARMDQALANFDSTTRQRILSHYVGDLCLRSPDLRKEILSTALNCFIDKGENGLADALLAQTA